MKNITHKNRAISFSGISMMMCLTLIAMFARAQTVTRAEYFFDNDKGYGKGTQVTLSASADSTWQLPVISTAGLTRGYHRLYIRTKDSSKRWSQTAILNIEVISNLAEERDSVIAAEYFIDIDPKFGKGKPITITSPDSALTKLFTIPASEIASQALGYHTVYGRVKSKSGRWSQTYSSRIEILKNEDSTSVVRVEYFFGDEDDAGFGSCHSKTVSITPPFNKDSATFIIPYNQLHFKANDTLFVRVRENINNGWSQTTKIKGLNITVVGPRLAVADGLNEFSVYPNPASNFIVIHFDREPDAPLQLQLTAPTGTVVMNQTIKQAETHINLNQPAGIYFVKLSNSKETIIRKIVVR